MTWVKNEDYWREGKPYLDGIEIKIIPNEVTAKAMMLNSEADMWLSPPVKDQAELEEKGFVRQYHPLGSPTVIYFDLNTNPDSKFQDLKVREAVEYALDRPAIADALGMGYYTPLLSLNGPGGWGYDPDYEGRPYNPEKATELLEEAGYPNGLKVSMLVSTTNNELAPILKGYLDAVGMETELDIADAGRLDTSVWIEGWTDMCLYISGADPDPLMAILVMFGPHPMNMPKGFLRTPELLAMGAQSLKQYNEAGKIDYTKKLVQQIADEVALVPLYLSQNAYMIQPYVHTTYLSQMSVCRYFENEWMDPH
jgi:ABC-type transport system substrate-binding protein